MKLPGIVRGYKVGKELIELCSEARSSGMERIDDFNFHPKYTKRAKGVAKKIDIIHDNGSLCTKFGMMYVASGLNPFKYYNGIAVYKMREGIPDTIF